MTRKDKQSDFNYGSEWRELAIIQVNNLLKGIRIERLHEYQKNMSPEDKVRNNTLLNRISPVGMDKGMGLDYIVKKETTNSIKPIIIRRFEDSDIYYKVPIEISVDQFCKILQNYYILIINDPLKNKENLITTFSLFPMDWLCNNRRVVPKLAESETNERRLSFYTKKGKIISPSYFGRHSINEEYNGLFPNSNVSLKQAITILFL